MKKLIPILLVFLLTACGANGIKVPQSPALKFLERKSGLIAYIGGDGNVYVTDQGATHTSQLTKDMTDATQGTMQYQLPTWSPDGSELAFIRIQKKGTSLTSDLFVANVDDDSVKNVYTSDIEYPFYLSWSPDNKNIGVLSSTASQQTLAFKSVAANGDGSRVLDTGSPLYWSWAPDGNTTIIHKNSGNPNAPDELSFLKLGDEVDEFVMDSTPASFQAPAWSPDGAHILLTTLSDSTQQITLADSTGAIQKNVAQFNLNTAFAWAPDSDHFAYILGAKQLQNGTLGPLHVTDLENSNDYVVNDDVIAFFWSPDSSEVAYFIPFATTPQGSSQQIVVLELHILDAATGESRKIATFQPTDEFFSIIPYIGQYHQSLTIWSPDGNNLVISFISSDGKKGIAVIPSSGVTEPRILVEGSFATWSWK